MLRPEILKLLEQNIGSKLSDTALRIFFGYVSYGQGNKSKKNQCDYIKLKSVCTAQETISK